MGNPGSPNKWVPVAKNNANPRVSDYTSKPTFFDTLLFDLSVDPNEENDISKDNPEIVKSMMEKLR